MNGIDLASLLGQLRAELTEALAEGERNRLHFELGPLELTLTVTIAQEAKSGRIRFWVVESGADGKSRDAVQQIKLVLTPRDMEAELSPMGKWTSA